MRQSAPKMSPSGLLALSERLQRHAKAAHRDQGFAADLKYSAFAVRRLACIAMMLDESKLEVNPQQRGEHRARSNSPLASMPLRGIATCSVSSARHARSPHRFRCRLRAIA